MRLLRQHLLLERWRQLDEGARLSCMGETGGCLTFRFSPISQFHSFTGGGSA